MIRPAAVCPFARDNESEGERGSAPVEALLVGILLTVLVLGILQFSLVVYVRNTALDAASEGARYAALADNELHHGIQRAALLLDQALGEGYSNDITAEYVNYRGRPAVVVRVRAGLPVLGVFSLANTLEVVGHAARENLD